MRLTNMKLLAGMVSTSVAVAHSAFAQIAGTDPSTMTCAEFVALDTAGRTGVMASIEAAAVAASAAIDEGTGADQAEGVASADGDVTIPVKTTETDPATTAATAASGEATTAGDAGPTDVSAAAGTDMAEAGDTTADGGDDITTALLAACSVPDMRVTDAFLEAQAGEAGGTETDAGASEGEASGG